MKHFICILIVFFSFGLYGKSTNNVIDQGQLRAGIAFGIGTITNPLHGGDNFPLVLIPEIAYYGEHVYFDNGQLGVTFLENNRHIVSFISEFNPENRFYVAWHPANVFINRNALLEPVTRDKIAITEINHPKWALDGGVNYQYIADSWRFSAAVLHDISNVHSGHRAALSLAKGWYFTSGVLSARIGFDYLSDSLADYYYGIQANDNVGLVYQQNDAYLPYLEVSWQMPINERFGLLAKIKYQHFGALSDSPLFSSDESMTIFTGVTHVF